MGVINRSAKRRIARDAALAVLGRTSRGRALIFRRMYRLNRWGDVESVSGRGSNLDNTKALREQLPDVLSRHEIRTLVDAPCGDVFWIRHTNLQLDRYIGIDIVPGLIAGLSDHPPVDRAEFYCLDVITAVPPTADAILCRDLLVHLTNEQVVRCLRNFKASGAEYLLTTTFPGRTNRDIVNGRWRALDFQAAPFGFPLPVALIPDSSPMEDQHYEHKSLGMWQLRDLVIPDL